jgi:hypothetical protein
MEIVEEFLAITLPGISYNEVVRVYNSIKAEPTNDLRSLRNVNYNNKKLFELLVDVLRRTVNHDSFLSVDFLISCGTNLRMTDNKGNNALHTFVTCIANAHDIDMVTNIFELLYESGTDLFTRNKSEQTVMNILLFGYRSVFRQHNNSDRPIYIRNPRYKQILNEFFIRKLAEKKYEKIIKIISNLTEAEHDELFKTLYTTSIKRINILLNQYKNLVLYKLENKNLYFHKEQVGKYIYDYLSYSPF